MKAATGIIAMLLAIAAALRAPAEDFTFIDHGEVFAEHECGGACVTCSALAPRWYARATAVHMDRITEDSFPLIFSTTNQTRQLSANDFDFDWSTGLDVSLTRKTWYDCGFELRYLDPRKFDSRSLVAIGGSDVVLNANPPVFAPNVQSIDARYQSELISFEANYLYAINDYVTYLAGFRYVGLDDDLRATLDAAPQTFLYDALTRNDLYGGQVGVMAAPVLPYCRLLCTSAFAKIGVFGNAGKHLGLVDTGVTELSIESRADKVAWIGEIGLSAELPITHHLSIVGGYSLLWLESVAIASDQMAVSDFFNSTGVNDRGGAVFHGANAGLVLEL